MEQPNNPLHGITLKALVEELVERHGFQELGARVRIRCFNEEPSVKSTLKFLRRTAWARLEVEQIYLDDLKLEEKRRSRNQERAARRAYAAAQDSDEGERPAD